MVKSSVHACARTGAPTGPPMRPLLAALLLMFSNDAYAAVLERR